MAVVRFVVPYFGPWPVWFPAYLHTCRYNPNVEWLFLTDNESPKETECPPNVKFRPLSMDGLQALAEEKIGCPVKKNAYSQCDLRPAYGVILSEFIKDVDFWGHCDVDVIWGRLASIFTEETLDKFDIISSRRGQLAGHCSIYRNCEKVNRLFERIPSFRAVMAKEELCRMNESAMANAIRQAPDIAVYWKSQHVVDARELDRRPNGWVWESGHVMNSDAVERAYLHFMSWKRSLRQIDFSYQDAPRKFRITSRALWAGDVPMSSQVSEMIPSYSRMCRRTYNSLRLFLTGRGRF
ncbi:MULTISPECIES: DUF6625 family protein [Pirellulaceae]|nr:DUF6625 family protein [Blastopirellula marina]